MILEVQNYIETHGTVSIEALSHRFHTDPSTLKPMLTRLTRKGRIRALPVPQKCSGCTACEPHQIECYRGLVNVEQ